MPLKMPCVNIAFKVFLSLLVLNCYWTLEITLKTYEWFVYVIWLKRM